jgi:hypothetical protein
LLIMETNKMYGFVLLSLETVSHLLTRNQQGLDCTED